MVLTRIAFTVVAIVFGLSVAAGGWILLSPLRQKPYPPGLWISVVFSGLAGVAVGIAGLVVAERGGFVGIGDYTLAGAAGALVIFGLLLVASGIRIYEPDTATER